ncbi:MAG: dipeptidyl aminopeptidase/acylaminoacyl peptidase [Actinomycetia bacterium]|nr:dipeptidyl aminopeptidase/acylaminoacyl peptidase [Actinomycetes bacterium]
MDTSGGGAVTAAMVARARSLADPQWSPSGDRLAWNESFGGRTDVLVAPADGSDLPLVVSSAIRPGGVHPSGGGVYAWAGDDALVVATRGDGLAVLPARGGPPVATVAGGGPAFAPAVSPDGRFVAYVRDTGSECPVMVAAIDASTAPVRISEASDFAWDPVWRPDGRAVTWFEWDLPAMPWTASRIASRAFRAVDGAPPELGPVEVLAGGPAVGVAQPRYSPDGTWLAYVSDAGGWANVWIARPDGADARPLLPEPFEQSRPPWGPRVRSFAWSPDSARVALVRNEGGFGRLVSVAVADGSGRDEARAWHVGPDWGPAGIAAIRFGARTVPQVTVRSPAGGARTVLARGTPGGFETESRGEPEAVTWSRDGVPVHGLVWSPRAAAGVPDDAGAPRAPAPMLVLLHGGPTDQALVDWQARRAFFLDRGWVVFTPNARGSTGYGREYRDAMNGGWGEVDVDDVAAGIDAMVTRGVADPARVAVMGGSAGGYSALMLCVRHPQLLRAAVSLYGVTDLLGLAAGTWRFESRYLDLLVGPLPQEAERYRARSPINRAAEIRTPLLLLQGDADEVVPLAQTRALVDALEQAAVPVEHHVYESEGHGWSRPETVIDELDRVEDFLARHVLGRATSVADTTTAEDAQDA